MDKHELTGYILWFFALLIVVSVIIRLAILKRVIYRRPHLQFEDLPFLLADPNAIKKIPSPRVMPGSDFSIQVGNATENVIYDRSHRDQLVETLEVTVRGKVGMLITLKDSRIVTLSYVGGKVLENPDLTIRENGAMRSFLDRVRELVRT